MKKLLGLNQDYQQLKDLGLIGSDFEQLQISLIYKYIRTMSHISSSSCQKEIESILKILNEENKSSYASIKILLFVNILINEKDDQNKDASSRLINLQITKILDLENRRYDKIKKWREREASITKGIDWVRQTFSRSKDKDRVVKSKSSIITQVTPRQAENMMNTSTNQIKDGNRLKQNKDIKDQGKQQLLISKIIIPYGTYLLKLSSSNMKPIIQANYQKLDNAKVWKTINLLKCVLKISQPFSIMMRYYQKQMSSLITILISVLNNSIKVYYPILQTYSVEKTKKIAKQITAHGRDNENKLQALEELINKYELNQFKEILDEASVIKQSMIVFYRSSSTYDKMVMLNIGLPGKYLEQYDSDENIVYHVLKQAQKYKKQEITKKQRSLSKNQNNISGVNLRLKLQLSKQTPRINNKSIVGIKSNLIAPKKQLQHNISQTLATQLAAKDTRQNNSTFRRIRMGMVQQLHGQTKRQRR